MCVTVVYLYAYMCMMSWLSVHAVFNTVDVVGNMVVMSNFLKCSRSLYSFYDQPNGILYAYE